MTTQIAPPEIKIGAARAAHVEGHLLADPTMKNQVGPRDAEVPRRDGIQMVMFHRLTVAVARRMMTLGLEPLQSSGAVVLDHARFVLDELAEDAAAGGTMTSPPMIPVQVASIAAPAPAPVTPPPVVAPPVVAAPVAAAPVVAAAAPVAVAQPKRRKASTTTEEAAAATEENGEEGEEATPVAAAGAKEPEVLIGLAIYSLIVSAQELAERDRAAGAAERKVLLVKAAQGYRKIVPV